MVMKNGDEKPGYIYQKPRAFMDWQLLPGKVPWISTEGLDALFWQKMISLKVKPTTKIIGYRGIVDKIKIRKLQKSWGSFPFNMIEPMELLDVFQDSKNGGRLGEHHPHSWKMLDV